MENNTTVKKVFGVIGAVLFFSSYLPYLFLVFVAINGFVLGLAGESYVYGFEAVCGLFVLLCIFPVYPVCILYQLIYGIVYIRKRKKLKIAAIAVVAVLAAAIFASCFHYEIRKRHQLNEDNGYIIEYLSDKYGDDIASDISISMINPEERCYSVTSHVLPDSARFTVYAADGTDNLVRIFEQYNENFHEDFENYLAEVYDLPENMSISVMITDIEFGDYRCGDDYERLFDGVDYKAAGITVDVMDLSSDDAIEIVSSVMRDQYPLFEGNTSNDDFWVVYLKDNGINAFSVTVLFDSMTAHFNRYSDYHFSSDLNGLSVELG